MASPALTALLGAHAAASSWDPLAMSNLVAGYDASDTASITESGGAVSAIADNTGNGNNAVQSNASYKPTTGANTVNGLNVLTMGNNKLLTATLGSSVSQPFTLYLVVYLTNFRNYGMLFGNAVQNTSGAGITTRNFPAFGFRAQSQVQSSASVSTGVAYSIVAEFNGSSSAITVAGVTDSSVDVSTNAIGTELDLGSLNGGQNDSMDGYWCEGYLRTGVGYSSDITGFAGYATSKWGAS